MLFISANAGCKAIVCHKTVLTSMQCLYVLTDLGKRLEDRQRVLLKLLIEVSVT